MSVCLAAVLSLACVVVVTFASADTSVPDTHPKYARVGDDIETVWQRPPGVPKGIFFIAHGCNHQSTDLFSDVGHDGWRFEACSTSNLGKCLGLPEEVLLRKIARRRGYLVAGVSGGTGHKSCWYPIQDAGRVATALQHVRKVEGLPQDLPVLAMGASSGGGFMGSLAQPGGLPGLQCIVPMIMGVHGAENRGVPTLFVHMPRDHRTAGGVESDVERLQGQGVRVKELHLMPKPVTLELLSRCFPQGLASEVLAAMKSAELLDGEGYLAEDPRRRMWVEAVGSVTQGKSEDSLESDESCLSEELNVAWAMHEISAEFGEEMIDFCEGLQSKDRAATPQATAALPPSTAAPLAQNQAGSAEQPPGGSGALRGTRAAAAPGLLQQLLVFDAGSSGTRVHVFDLLWKRPAHVPVVRDDHTNKTKPGLSAFAKIGDLDGAQQSIEGLLAFANKFVEVKQRPSTPALLKATAGLRSVSGTQADAVLARVRRTLAASGYRFEHSWADIIRGKEEAGLAWVAANYLNGTFNSSGEATTLGIIEMGGGSTQVSFEVGEADKLAESDNFTFTTGLGRTYRLYAHSYAGYGQDYAQERLQQLLPPDKVRDPCYPHGYSRPRQPAGAQVPDVTVEGTGNAAECSKNIEVSLLDAKNDGPGRYSAELPLRGQFVATQNFFFLRNELQLELAGSPEDMVKASYSACDQWEALVKTMSKIPEKQNHCFGLSYQAVVMRELRKHEVGKVDVTISNSVKGVEADWALGAALVHALQEVPQNRQPGHAAQPLAAAVALILAALALWRLLRPYLWRSNDPQVRYRKGIDATRIGASKTKVALVHTLHEVQQNRQPGPGALSLAAATLAALVLWRVLRPYLWRSNDRQVKYRRGIDATRIGAFTTKVAALE